MSESTARPKGKRRMARWQAWLPALVIVASIYPALALNLDDRLMLSLSGSWRDPQAAASGLDLDGYKVRVEAREVADVSDNLSGLAYDAGRGQLWAVVNDPAELLALSKDGQVLSRYRLEGFDDVEGVAYLGDDLVAVAEERRNTLVIVAIPGTPGPIAREGARTISLDVGTNRNRGLEGVGYDRRGDRLFTVKEHSPRRLFQIQGVKAEVNGGPEAQVVELEGWVGDKTLAEDLSSVEYDEASGHLVLLSDESRLLVELDGEGRLVSLHTLSSGFAGLGRRVPRAEGMALDDRGNLYLVSEPNLFYAFNRK